MTEGNRPPPNEVLDEIVSLLEASREQLLRMPERLRAIHQHIATLPEHQRDEALGKEQQEITRTINEPWLQALTLMQRVDPAEIKRDGRIPPLMQSIWDTQAGSRVWTETGSPQVQVRPSTRKIEMPWEPGTLFPTPNLQGNGTRNLGRAASGDVVWQDDANESNSMLALVGGRAVARVDLTPGREGEALRSILTQVLSPRALKTMVGISRLIWERTDRKPLNRAITVRLGELARAAGYEPGNDRHIKAEIRQRLGLELRALCSISTWAADGPYDAKSRTYKSAWAAKLLVIPAVHLDQLTADGGPVPDELDVMLGRNWAEAYANTDLVQIAPGFMKLHDDNVIRLGWYYQTEFRYRMTDPRVSIKRSIRSLCSESDIDPGQAKHRGRFLERLEKWHAELLKTGVIGAYRREPAPGEDVAPLELFERGEYTVRPPQPILDAYADARGKAAVRPPRRKQARRQPDRA